jgi:peptidoglycan/xylan/chitin deacetylase (PgdA/CDA1 family)
MKEKLRKIASHKATPWLGSLVLLAVIGWVVWFGVGIWLGAKLRHKADYNKPAGNIGQTSSSVTTHPSEYEFAADNIPPLKEGQLRVPILMYHHVGDLPEKPDAIRRDLTVSTDNFTEQVAWAKEQGYESVTLEQVYLASQGKFSLPKKPIVFTFDDGYADVFMNAWPVLHAVGYTGSFAIITHMVGNPDYATWERIRAAASQGAEIVSHTQTHFDGSNTKYSPDFIRAELAGSKQDLADHGLMTNVLVYPYGHFTPSYVAIAKEVGYVMGFTVAHGFTVDPETLMTTPRLRVHRDTDLQKFIEQVELAKQ